MNQQAQRICEWPGCGHVVEVGRYGPRRGPKASRYCIQHRLIRRHGPVDGQTIYERITAARARADAATLTR
jgi:hypothetical protein